MTKGWHWLDDEGLLRDGTQPPPDGEWLVHDGPLLMCESGLHYSKRLIDALQYALGNVLCRVECRGKQKRGTDKSVCTQRRILWRINAQSLLRDFARRCALDVVHLWDAPKVVIRYLETGNESLRSATRSATRADASAAASAAWSTTRGVSWGAARGAARAAKRTAWGAAKSAAESKQNRRLVAMVIAEAKRQGVYKR